MSRLPSRPERCDPRPVPRRRRANTLSVNHSLVVHCSLLLIIMSSLPLCSVLFLGLIVVFLNSVQRAEGGECCRSHYDRFGLRHETTWCSHYCCQDRGRAHSSLYCCSDFFMRADRSDRLDFCSSWFTASANLWAPVLIAIVIIAILIGCGICCCCIPGFCFCC